MHDLFPRQSGSGGATSSGSATIVPSASSGNIDTSVQTSGFTTATAVTTALFSSQSPSAPFSADATTTPATTGTTSEPQTTTSASPSSSPTQVSSTPTSTSSSPSPSSQPTSSSTASPSTPAAHSSTAPPTSSYETQTTIISTYTTYESGTPIVTSSAIPTTIPLVSESSSSNRTAIIAGSAAGGTALLILLLSLAFFARRKRFKRLDFLNAITHKRKQDRTRESFLAGEDLYDVDLARPPLRYADYNTPWDGSTRALMVGREANYEPTTPGTTMPSRWSETGSAFREDLWSPPHEGTRLMDPLANRDDLDLDLSRIVDDVMGPSDKTAAAHFTNRSVSSMYRGSTVDSDGVHSRTVSNSSNAALLDAAGLSGTMTAPVRSSPLAQRETTSHSAEKPS